MKRTTLLTFLALTLAAHGRAAAAEEQPGAAPEPPAVVVAQATEAAIVGSEPGTPDADAPDDAAIDQKVQEESAVLRELRQAEQKAHPYDAFDLQPGNDAAAAAARLGFESPLRQRLGDAFLREFGGGRDAAAAIPGLPEIDHDLRRLQAEYDIPIDVNEAVIAYVRFFQNPRVRPHFVRYLERSHRYIPRYREILREEGLPEDTVYLAMIESGFSNLATSSAKAVGPWQFIPATGKRFGLDQDFWIDERRDPEKAARAAARYLKELYGQTGDWRLAWAGYNAGVGKIFKARRKGYDDFWEMTRGHRVLHPETKGYVPKLMAAAILAKHPEAFGFGKDEIEPERWAEYEEVVVPRATELSFLAEAAGVPEKALLDLNPELRRTCTPPRSYALKIPKGKRELFAASWPSIAERAAKKSVARHRVVKGETVAAIAGAYGLPANTLAKLNGLKPGRRVKPGSVLVVPLGALARREAEALAATLPAPELEPEPVRRVKHGKAAARQKAASAAVASAAPTRARAASAAVRGTIKVQAGDTLWGLARKFNVAVEELARWNGIRNPKRHTLKAGQTLVVQPRISAAVGGAQPAGRTAAP
jgi:membrane-bound lytic murein transglycosylase D